MTPLIVVPQLAVPDAAAALNLPPLPALEELLRRGAALPAAVDWRGGVLQDLGMDAKHLPAVAAVAAGAMSPGVLRSDAAICMLTPVHTVAGISRVFLAPQGVLQLQAQESQQLADDFAREFASDDTRLHAVGADWLLEAPFAAAASDADPALLAGVALSREAARSDALRALRRLGAEVEMWLASLPLNQARERRGALRISGFWFWGGGMAADLPARSHAARQVYVSATPDAWWRGVAQHCGAGQCVPASSGEVVSARVDALLHLPAPDRGASIESLQVWDEQWFAPLLRDLCARRIAGLNLRIGTQAWQMRGGSWRAWWRRRRPWWQVLQATEAAS